MPKEEFRFKRFTIRQDRCAMKVSTDGVLFGAWVRYGSGERVLDIGTGTGLLALIAAQRDPDALIDAVEVDADAAAQAAENIAASPWPDRIRVHHMDVTRMHAADHFDLILCNPPYYSGYSAPTDERVGLAKHAAALDLPELMDVVDRCLAAHGRFATIIPLSREATLLRSASERGLVPTRRCAVRYVPHRPPKRVLLELQRGAAAPEEEELTVEATGSFDYSPAYRKLIADLLPGF